jgi:glycosyltransferase involved in cell wall biosynthesis
LAHGVYLPEGPWQIRPARAILKWRPPIANKAVKLPVVCIFGAENIRLHSAPVTPPHETTALDCRCYPDDHDLERILIEQAPHVIITCGDLAVFKNLMAAPFEIRRRWLHYPSMGDLATIGSEAFLCYLSVVADKRDEMPLVSVFTPAYKTGDRLQRPFFSLRSQSYDNWEWVVLDDSDDAGETYRLIRSFAERDHRISAFRPERHSGIIGDVKYRTCALSRGEILVELDHDDELTPNALEDIVATFGKYPEAGFLYSDFCEVDTQGNPLRYPDGWAYGYGSYRDELYRDKVLKVANAPAITPKTIRHLVSAPNHVRAWTRSCYFAIGGHNRLIHVADDFELMIRTFLHTRMMRIPKLCYLQYLDGGNTQRIRNQDIQRHVRYLRWKYDRQIHARFLELGIEDWVWNEEKQCADMDRPNPPMETPASIVAEP